MANPKSHAYTYTYIHIHTHTYIQMSRDGIEALKDHFKEELTAEDGKPKISCIHIHIHIHTYTYIHTDVS